MPRSSATVQKRKVVPRFGLAKIDRAFQPPRQGGDLGLEVGQLGCVGALCGHPLPSLTSSSLQTSSPSAEPVFTAIPRAASRQMADLGRFEDVNSIGGGQAGGDVKTGRRPRPVIGRLDRQAGAEGQPVAFADLAKLSVTSLAGSNCGSAPPCWSAQLIAFTPKLNGTPQRVGLVKKGSGREPGGRGSETMQLSANTSAGVQRSCRGLDRGYPPKGRFTSTKRAAARPGDFGDEAIRRSPSEPEVDKGRKVPAIDRPWPLRRRPAAASCRRLTELLFQVIGAIVEMPIWEPLGQPPPWLVEGDKFCAVHCWEHPKHVGIADQARWQVEADVAGGGVGILEAEDVRFACRILLDQHPDRERQDAHPLRCSRARRRPIRPRSRVRGVRVTVLSRPRLGWNREGETASETPASKKRAADHRSAPRRGRHGAACAFWPALHTAPFALCLPRAQGGRELFDRSGGPVAMPVPAGRAGLAKQRAAGRHRPDMEPAEGVGNAAELRAS